MKRYLPRSIFEIIWFVLNYVSPIIFWIGVQKMIVLKTTREVFFFSVLVIISHVVYAYHRLAWFEEESQERGKRLLKETKELLRKEK